MEKQEPKAGEVWVGRKPGESRRLRILEDRQYEPGLVFVENVETRVITGIRRDRFVLLFMKETA